MAEEDIFDPLRRGVTGVATGIGDAVSGIGQGVSNAVSGVGGALGGALGGFSKMSNEDLGALANMLGRTGSALMALGQPGYNPQLRQQALMALGNVPGQVATDRFKAVQSKLMQARMKQEMARMAALQKLDAYRNTPEGAANIVKETGIDLGTVKSLPTEQLLDLQTKIAVRLAVQRSQAAQMAQIMGPIIGGGGAAAPAASTPAASVSQTAGGAPAAQATGVTPAAGGEAPEAAAEKPVAAITIPTLDQSATRNAALTQALQRAALLGNQNAVNAITKMMEQKSPYATEGQKEEDKQFAKENVKWVRTGIAAAKSDLEDLQFAKDTLINALKRGKSLTGGPAMLLTSALGTMAVTHPEAKVAMDRVLRVAQKSLKEILGGQFAQKEGEEFLKRAFDPALSVGENIKRINILMSTINEVAGSKSAANAHFRKYGTMAQFSGPQYSSKDIMDTLKKRFEDKTDGISGATGGAKAVDFTSLK